MDAVITGKKVESEITFGEKFQMDMTELMYL